MMRGGTLLILSHVDKGQGHPLHSTLPMKTCGHDAAYSLITFKLHM